MTLEHQMPTDGWHYSVTDDQEQPMIQKLFWRDGKVVPDMPGTVQILLHRSVTGEDFAMVMTHGDEVMLGLNQRNHDVRVTHSRIAGASKAILHESN